MMDLSLKKIQMYTSLCTNNVIELIKVAKNSFQL